MRKIPLALFALTCLLTGTTLFAACSTTHIHEYGEWEVLTPATCTEDGVSQRVCDCGDTQSKILYATGHNFQDGKCTRCGETETTPASDGLNLELNYDNSYYVVRGIGSCTDISVTIPSEYKNLPVKAIAYGAFEDCYNLVGISIPESITTIGRFAFYGCNNLESVTIPDSVTEIQGAFNFCSSLTSVTIGKGLKSIEDSDFTRCDRLESFTVNEDNVTFSSINGVLYNKSKTAIVRVPTAIKGDLTLPNELTEIGDYKFSSCINLTSVIMPDSVVSIGNYAFYSCTGLKSISLSDRLTAIGDYVFAQCDSLTDIIIPDGVTTIGTNSFFNCKNLKDVTLPNSVISIGHAAFNCCNKLNYNDYDNARYLGNDVNPYVALICATDDINITNCEINSKTKIIYESAFIYRSSLTEIIIPDSVVKIGESAFESCLGLAKLNIPDSVVSLGESAFAFCKNLKDVTFGKGITKISRYTFNNCDELECIVLPDNIIEIDKSAFAFCSSLKSVTIKNNTIYIRSDAFNYCSNLTDIYFNGTKEQWSLYLAFNWDFGAGNYTVHCTDGDINKK